MKTIGVIGTRSRDSSISDMPLIKAAIMRIYDDGDQLVSGGCPQGGDRFAEMIAKTEQIPITIHYARWNKFGKRAGYVRNGDIADDADVLIASVSQSRIGGTEDTIKKFLSKIGLSEQQALDAGKLVLV